MWHTGEQKSKYRANRTLLSPQLYKMYHWRSTCGRRVCDKAGYSAISTKTFSKNEPDVLDMAPVTHKLYYPLSHFLFFSFHQFVCRMHRNGFQRAETIDWNSKRPLRPCSTLIILKQCEMILVFFEDRVVDPVSTILISATWFCSSEGPLSLADSAAATNSELGIFCKQSDGHDRDWN